MDFLSSKGFNIADGLSYLGDEGMYEEILKDFFTGFPSQLNEIKAAFDAKDIANYTILVHALKSNCRTLGINELADMAYSHELKGKENDINFINDNFVALYNKAVEIYNIMAAYFKM